MNIQRTALAVAATFALTTIFGVAQAAPERHRQMVESQLAHHKQFVDQEFLVRFRDDVPESERAALLARVGVGAGSSKLVAARGFAGSKHDMHMARGARDMRTAMATLNADPRVEFAEPNWVFRPAVLNVQSVTSTTRLLPQSNANDPYFTAGYQWNMAGAATSPSSYYGTGAMAAWTAGHTCGATPIYIGVIDQGVSIAHPDLTANIWTNMSERTAGRDGDGNGYIYDINGYNFVNNTSNVAGSAAEPHGTHVAGIIGAVGNNGIGVSGLCWNVKIIPAKFMDATGGTLANAIRAIDYLTNLKLKKNIKLVATNNSWSGGGYSQALADAIERANAADILFVVAAGNGGDDNIGDNNDVTPMFPANFTNANVISVAAIDKTGARASFSNYGATTVHLGAPGVDILSTVPTASGTGYGYGYMSGTSMAAPHVTAAAALYASLHPTATGAEIKAAILSSVRPNPAMQGITTTGGVLDVSKF